MGRNCPSDLLHPGNGLVEEIDLLPRLSRTGTFPAKVKGMKLDYSVWMSESDLKETMSSLQSVTHGALVSIIGILLDQGLVFLTNVVLARGLGVNLYGVYAYGERIVRMLLGVADLGTSPALVRYLPEHEDSTARQNSILGLTYVTSFVASLTIAIGLAVFAPHINELTVDHPLFVDAFRILVFLLPAEILAGVVVNHFRSLELVEYQISLGKVARPSIRLVAVGLALALGYSLIGVVVAVVASTALLMAGSFVLSLTQTPQKPSMTGWSREVRDFYNSSFPLAFSNIGNILTSRVDILFIGYFLTANAVAIYNIALLLGDFVRLFLSSFNQLFPTVASQLYVEEDYKALNAVYSAVARLAFTAALAIGLAISIYRVEILTLVGPEYTDGDNVLLLFVLSQLIATVVGPAGWLLFVTDHQYIFAIDEWALGALNLGFSVYFILQFGLIGAALGTAGSLAIINVLRILQLWYLEGLFPITSEFSKPVVAGAGAGVVMYILGQFLSGPVLLILGTAIGWSVFGVLYYIQGISEIDEALFYALFEQYRSQGNAFLNRFRG